MTARILGATIGRILRQLRHDPRTIGLMLLVPVLLMTLLYFMFDGRQPMVSGLLLIMLGIFPFVIMFLVTSIAMLRERQSGTLERLMTTPTGKLDLLFGYGISFGIAAALQAVIAAGFGYLVLSLDTAGPPLLVIVIAVLNAVLGVGIGLLCSAFARTEFQAVQLLPVIVIPQLLLCGLFVPREAMTGWLQVISDVMPLSYAVHGLQEVGSHSAPTGLLWRDLGIVAGCVILALTLAAATLPRRTE
jgi:ABC-2 type transport system permease protein